MFKIVPLSKPPSASSTGGAGAAPGGDAAVSNQPAMYASISSAPQHSSGKILTVGRHTSKGNNCDFTFENEKGVSRRHICLTLVKLGADTPPGTPEATAEDSAAMAAAEQEARTNAFAKPRDPDEIAACQAASDGIILVVEDIGSKFGTEIEYEVPCEDGASDDSDEGDAADGKLLRSTSSM